MLFKWAELWWFAMRSEIPQIEVVTAIGDADFEDYVAQLLFTQGWSIIYRAFDGEALLQYMTERSLELRTVIVYTTDLPGFAVSVMDELASQTVSAISLDEVAHTAHEIMQKIRSQLRLPMVHSQSPAITPQISSPKMAETTRTVILVTGSSSGPGKTQLCLALAEELSTQKKVTLIDADFASTSLELSAASTRFSIISLHASEKPTSLPETDSKEIIIVDVGVLPPLGEVVNDRRWLAQLHNSIFDCTTQLIYVSQSTKSSLMQLDQFKKEFPILMKKVSPTYINVAKGGSKEIRRAQNAFLQLVTGEKNYEIPEAALLPKASGFVDSLLTSGAKGRKVIGSIATSLL